MMRENGEERGQIDTVCSLSSGLFRVQANSFVRHYMNSLQGCIKFKGAESDLGEMKPPARQFRANGKRGDTFRGKKCGTHNRQPIGLHIHLLNTLQECRQIPHNILPLQSHSLFTQINRMSAVGTTMRRCSGRVESVLQP